MYYWDLIAVKLTGYMAVLSLKKQQHINIYNSILAYAVCCFHYYINLEILLNSFTATSISVI